jgi:hypothetical protein
MAKDHTKMSPQKKPRRATEQEPRALRIKISKRSIEEVDLAIRKKLEAEPTDLFRNSDTLIIVLEREEC